MSFYTQDASAHSSDFTIRPFHSDDLPIIQDIRHQAFANIFADWQNQLGQSLYGLVYKNVDKEQADYLQEVAMEGRVFVLTCKQGNVAGFISFSMDLNTGIGELGLNAVAPAYQGQGCSRLMYEYAFSCMRAKGITAVKVSTGADKAHEPARRAYQKVGFQQGIASTTLLKPL
ncbi:MAG: GNAT family N-acetyltransferase [Alphaproteobacteria bacterium]|nr:GNAT family N-acetyltransferase [Alphaproteobacteria bacterium]